jgi:hypothetical protein
LGGALPCADSIHNKPLRSPATVNSMIKAISVLFVWARKQGLWSTNQFTRRR